MPFSLLHHSPLAHLTTLGLGGPALELASARTEADLIESVRDADARALPVLILGSGSNLVVADGGFPGRVIRVLTRGVAIGSVPGAREVLVHAAAGEPWDDLVAATVSQGLSGLECLSGIPGLVGATPIQNVGAYGQEVADTLVSVRAWDRLGGTVVTLHPADCRFGYRDSVFKREARGRYVLLEVTFALLPGAPPGVRYADLARALAVQTTPPSLATVREAVLSLRRGKSMVLDPADPESRSVGSFFTNPVVSTAESLAVAARARARGVLPPGDSMPMFPQADGTVKLSAGWLIERAGIAPGTTLGTSHSGVAVSRRHALALVHHGGGTSDQLVSLARHVRETVRVAMGVCLTPEPVFVGFPSDDPVTSDGFPPDA